MHALQVTADDIATALDRLGLDGYIDDLAERWMEHLDLGEAARAASDCGGDLDDQTDALVSEIEMQLSGMGVPEKSLEEFVAEREAQALDGQVPVSNIGGAKLRL